MCKIGQPLRFCRSRAMWQKRCITKHKNIDREPIGIGRTPNRYQYQCSTAVSTRTDRCPKPVRYLPTPTVTVHKYYLKGRLPTVVSGAKYSLSSQSSFFFSFTKDKICSEPDQNPAFKVNADSDVDPDLGIWWSKVFKLILNTYILKLITFTYFL
jgi:hypothetical protein